MLPTQITRVSLASWIGCYKMPSGSKAARRSWEGTGDKAHTPPKGVHREWACENSGLDLLPDLISQDRLGNKDYFKNNCFVWQLMGPLFCLQCLTGPGM